jgi:myo-inositol-1(or 4)-monophosphatase
MSMESFTDLLTIAEDIALDAGQLLRAFYKRGVHAEYKGDVDIVTEADRASEKLIVTRLHDRLPDHGVYGEEGTRSGLDKEYRWYVDPLDGTTNFAHGFPVFCVVLGCERRRPGLAADEDGEMVVGVIYDPLRDEMFSAARGYGATLNGAPIHVSGTKLLQESLIATGFPSQKRHESPNVHFYQEFKLNPWDTSAGYLLVEEAGGKVTHFDGSKFTLDSRETLATNGRIHKEMETLFGDMFAGRDLERIPTPAEFAAKRAAEK